MPQADRFHLLHFRFLKGICQTLLPWNILQRYLQSHRKILYQALLKLSNPGWDEEKVPLAEEGKFTTPPKAIHSSNFFKLNPFIFLIRYWPVGLKNNLRYYLFFSNLLFGIWEDVSQIGFFAEFCILSQKRDRKCPILTSQCILQIKKWLMSSSL